MRPKDFRRLSLAAKRGQELLKAWPNEDGVTKWVIETEQLLRDLFSQTQLWANFVQGSREAIVMQAPPEDLVVEKRRRDLRYRVESLEAALETVKRRKKDGPVPRDPLLEGGRLASEIPLTDVADYITAANQEYERANWEEAVNQAAKAYERAVHALADLVTGKVAPRDFSGAMDVLKNRGVIQEETAKALKVPDVSLWGWLCIKGRHAAGAAKGKPADTWTEARYALDWVGSAIAFLGESYLEWIRKSRASQSGNQK